MFCQVWSLSSNNFDLLDPPLVDGQLNVTEIPSSPSHVLLILPVFDLLKANINCNQDIKTATISNVFSIKCKN